MNFNFKWIYGLEPHPPPLSSQKNKMLIFGLRSTSDDQPGWPMDWNSVCHPSPAKNVKWFFLDYVQLLVIDRAIQAMKVNRNVPKGNKKTKYSFL